MAVKKRAFSLAEFLVVFFIMEVILAGMLSLLNIGQYSFPITAAKVDIQAEVRTVSNWINKDVRQTVAWNIADNTPGPNYIKFKQVIGIDTDSSSATYGNYILSDDDIEYVYDPIGLTLTRNVVDSFSVSTQSWQRADIITSPFFTRDAGNSLVAMNESDLRNSARIIINLRKRKTIRTNHVISGELASEVKIRNE